MDKYAFLKGYMDKRAGDRLEEILAVLKNPEVMGALAGGVGGAGLGALVGGKGKRLLGAGVGGAVGAGTGYAGGKAYEKKQVAAVEKEIQQLLKDLENRASNQQAGENA